MIKVGIIGCGYWGPNLLRNFHDHPQCVVKRVAELDASRISYIQEKYPSIETTKDYFDVFGSMDDPQFKRHDQGDWDQDVKRQEI